MVLKINNKIKKIIELLSYFFAVFGITILVKYIFNNDSIDIVESLIFSVLFTALMLGTVNLKNKHDE